MSVGRRGGRGVLVLALAVVAGCTIELRPATDDVFDSGEGFELGRTPAAQQARRQPPPPPRRQVIDAEGVVRLPVFSSAVRAGNLLFLSGQLGALPDVMPPQLVEGGVEAETRQTMENIRVVLAADDLTLEDLVKCTVFLADIADYAAVNEVYAQAFPSEPPARSALAGSGLALGARVEIECIAAYPEGR